MFWNIYISSDHATLNNVIFVYTTWIQLLSLLNPRLLACSDWQHFWVRFAVWIAIKMDSAQQILANILAKIGKGIVYKIPVNVLTSSFYRLWEIVRLNLLMHYTAMVKCSDFHSRFGKWTMFGTLKCSVSDQWTPWNNSWVLSMMFWIKVVHL